MGLISNSLFSLSAIILLSTTAHATETLYRSQDIVVRKAANFSCARPVVEFEGLSKPVQRRTESYDNAATATVETLATQCTLNHIAVQHRFNSRNAGSSRINASEMLSAKRCAKYPDINPPKVQQLSGGPLAGLGYPKSSYVGKAGNVDLHWGYTSDRSTSYLVMVHHDPQSQKVAGLTEQPDRSHQFAPSFVSAMNERLSCLKYSIRTLYARHYVAGYDTEQTLEAQNQANIQAPIFSTNWRFDHKSKRYQPSINGFFGTFSAVDHCLENKVTDRQNPALVSAQCPGYSAPENLLAARGLSRIFIADRNRDGSYLHRAFAW